MRRWFVRGLRLCGVLVVALGAYLGWLQWTGNAHAVIEGELYRAAQVTPRQMADHSASEGIKSVLNLRGAHPGDKWYDDEVTAAKSLGLTHADFAMSSSRVITPEEATRLIALMRELPKPLLIHCRSGADRTGLASALYVAAIAGQGEEAAEDQMSLWFGHFGVPFLSAAYAMDDTWERLEPALGFPDS